MELRTLGSVIHYAYVQGDYAKAEIEIADLGSPPKTKVRAPCIRAIPREEILGLPELRNEIEDVYRILRELAEG